MRAPVALVSQLLPEAEMMIMIKTCALTNHALYTT
jgi:hypothetical protein